MKPSRLDVWVREVEGLPVLTRESLEDLQLRRLNETLTRLKLRGGFYAEYPDHLDDLSQLSSLPFTTAEMLARHPGAFFPKYCQRSRRPGACPPAQNWAHPTVNNGYPYRGYPKQSTPHISEIWLHIG